MFDNDFQRQWRARDIKIMIDNPEKGAANNQMSTGGYVVSGVYFWTLWVIPTNSKYYSGFRKLKLTCAYLEARDSRKPFLANSDRYISYSYIRASHWYSLSCPVSSVLINVVKGCVNLTHAHTIVGHIYLDTTVFYQSPILPPGVPCRPLCGPELWSLWEKSSR